MCQGPVGTPADCTMKAFESEVRNGPKEPPYVATTRLGKIVISSTTARLGSWATMRAAAGNVFGVQGGCALLRGDRDRPDVQDRGIHLSGVDAAGPDARLTEFGVDGLGQGGHSELGSTVGGTSDHARPFSRPWRKC